MLGAPAQESAYASWQDQMQQWKRRDLAEESFVYVWTDGDSGPTTIIDQSMVDEPRRKNS